MHISPVINNYLNYSSAKFTGSCNDMDDPDENLQNEVLKDTKYEPALYGALTATAIIGALAIASSKINDNSTDKFMRNVQKIYDSEDIKKDTFTVKDITDDKKPDIILYKKDGSKVVLDIYKQQILQETKKLDVIN